MLRRLERSVSPLKGRVERIGERLNRYFVINLIMRTFRELSADDATHMAAGIAYYAVFSLFPLLLGLIALFAFFGDQETITAELTEFAAEYLPGAEDLIQGNVNVALEVRGALGVFSALGLLWSASAVFGALNRSINRAWDVHTERPFYLGKPRHLMMALAVGLLFFLSTAAATLVSQAQRITDAGLLGMGFLDDISGAVVLQIASTGPTVCIFLIVYKFLPNTRTQWRYIWPGAIVGAVLFEVAKRGFLLYVGAFANFDHVYGSLAPLIALMVWAYIGSYIVILGAELGSEYERLSRQREAQHLAS